MKQEMERTPNETPILCVLLVLGLLSYMAVVPVIHLQNKSLLISDYTILAGFICALIALPLGSKPVTLGLVNARIQHITRINV